MKNYLNSNFSRLENTHQFQEHNAFQQSAKNILQNLKP